MRFIPVIGAAVGLTAIGALVVHFGADAVVRSLLAIGWGGLAAICLIHLVLIAVMGIAWRALVPDAPRWAFIWGRLIRDAGSEVLPLSQMGGTVLGARAVTLAGISGPVAAASTIVDLTLEFFAKLAYTALGLVLLVHLRPDLPVAFPITVGIVAAVLIAIALPGCPASWVRPVRSLRPCARSRLGRPDRRRRCLGSCRTPPHLSAQGRFMERASFFTWPVG